MGTKAPSVAGIEKVGFRPVLARRNGAVGTNTLGFERVLADSGDSTRMEGITHQLAVAIFAAVISLMGVGHYLDGGGGRG